MKELNYDEVLAPPKLKITICGEEYEATQPSLQQIFDYETRADELQGSAVKGVSASEVGEKWIKLIQSIFTCIPDEVLKKKSFSVICKVAADAIAFMQESMYVDAPEEEKVDKKKVK